MFNWILKKSCKHPFKSLVVQKAETREQKDKDFDIVTYHLKCNQCNEEIKKKYATARGGVEAFLVKK